MRATTFISKPPSSWAAQTEELTTARYYLMTRIGPTVFQIKDDEDRSFKVTLGNPHRCSCLNVMQPCIHAAFCIVKVLKVSVSHSLAYQSSWTDSDLEQVLSGACMSMASRTDTRRLRIMQKRNSPSEEIGAVIEEDPGTVQRQLLGEEEDNYCAICQELMPQDELVMLTWCRDGCGNNMHAACMLKYSQHLQLNRKETNCPLCRAPWNMEVLQKDSQRAQKAREKMQKEKLEQKTRNSKFRTIPVICAQCTCRQQSIFYRCIDCSHMNFVKSTQGVTIKQRLWDMCEACVSRSLMHCQSHAGHLFLANDASEIEKPERSWTFTCTSGSGLSIVRDGGDIAIATRVLESLPTLKQLLFLNLWHSQRFHCWICGETTRRNNADALCSPCMHAAHHDCLLQLVAQFIETVEVRAGSSAIAGGAGEVFLTLLRMRCGADGCGKRLFPALKRTIRNISAHPVEEDSAGMNESSLEPLSVIAKSLVGNTSVRNEVPGRQSNITSTRISSRRFVEQFQSAIRSDFQLNGSGINIDTSENNISATRSASQQIHQSSGSPLLFEQNNDSVFSDRVGTQPNSVMQVGKRARDMRALSRAHTINIPRETTFPSLDAVGAVSSLQVSGIYNVNTRLDQLGKPPLNASHARSKPSNPSHFPMRSNEVMVADTEELNSLLAVRNWQQPDSHQDNLIEANLSANRSKQSTVRILRQGRLSGNRSNSLSNNVSTSTNELLLIQRLTQHTS